MFASLLCKLGVLRSWQIERKAKIWWWAPDQMVMLVRSLIGIIGGELTR